MKLLTTILLFDCGGIAESTGWIELHSAYARAIKGIQFPENSGRLLLRQKSRKAGSTQWNRNGVAYLRNQFLKNMVDIEGWQSESQFELDTLQEEPALRVFPSMDPYSEKVRSRFGNFDFMTRAENGLRAVIEWETGNISSSHRSMNKLAIALRAGKIDAGVLVLPSRAMYAHMTDRIGNIDELSPYLSLWSEMAPTIDYGLLAVAVVEHDGLTDNTDHPYLPVGNDGRSRRGRE